MSTLLHPANWLRRQAHCALSSTSGSKSAKLFPQSACSEAVILAESLQRSHPCRGAAHRPGCCCSAKE